MKRPGQFHMICDFSMISYNILVLDVYCCGVLTKLTESPNKQYETLYYYTQKKNLIKFILHVQNCSQFFEE
jgi:hypothetical protein